VSTLIPGDQTAGAAAVVLVSLAVSAVYLYVGYRLAERRTSAGSRLASFQFAVWWGGLGVSVGIGGIELLLAIAGALPFALAMTFYLVSILVDCIFLWGLTGFLTYVYTGRYHLVEVGLIYIVLYVTILYWFFSRAPYAVAFEAAQPVWRYTNTGGPVLLELVLVLVLLAPEIVGAILYLSLRRKTQDSAQRYRITLVGGGILIWFGLDLFIPATTIPWVIFRTVLLVIPGLMSLFAFFPPVWARRKYGATAFETALADGREAVPRP
jgi:hypothetical protein